MTFDLPLISLTKGLFCSQSFSSLAFFSRNSKSFCLWYGPVGALLVWFFIRWLGGRREFWEKNKTHVELSYWFRKIGNSGENKTYSMWHEFCSPHRGSSSVENPRCPPCISVFHGVLFFYSITQKSTETHGGTMSDIDSRALSGPPSVWKISNCL